ncbi:MAG TPA: hypothetical protein VIO64_07830 [Pseudobacteroides sp.]|uniref:hypothetical protein n=1 Tax=Pseudobacteroides sp. TaxID=1968840 RepID=UPI002F92278C
MGNQGGKNTSIYIYITAIIILTVISVLMGIKGLNEAGGTKVRLLFILIPVIFVLVGNLAKSIISIFLRGLLAQAFGKMSVMLGWGGAAFVFFFLLPEADKINKASLGVPFVALIITFNSCFYEFIKNNIIFSRIIKAVLYFIQGFILRQMISALWENGSWSLGVQISVGDMVFFGHIMMFCSVLISMLELSDNSFYKKLGEWFSRNLWLKFMAGCMLVLYFKDIRSQMSDSFPSLFVYVEWAGILFVLLIIFIVAFSKIRGDRAPQFHERFGKHVQEIIYNKSYEGREISMFLEEYVNRGELSGILAFLVGLAKERMIPDMETRRLIKPLTDFKGVEVPKVCYKSEYNHIMQMNMGERKKIIEVVIWNIKNYGRNTGYVYQNEYWGHTDNMHKDY